MPTIQQREACPHCQMMNLADFLGPTALAVQARGICPNCLKWQATGLAAYEPDRVPASAEQAAGGAFEINRVQSAAAAD